MSTWLLGEARFFLVYSFLFLSFLLKQKKQNKKQKNIMRLPNTLNILTGRKLAGKLKEDIMKEVVVQLGDVDSILAVQIGYEIVRVTFCSDEAFSRAKSMEGVSPWTMVQNLGWWPCYHFGPRFRLSL